jgi:hypothetical protein
VTTEGVRVDQAALDELERRALEMNAKLHGLMKLLRAGETDRALSVAGLLQEQNATQRRGLISAGAADSATAQVGGYSKVWDDDAEPVDADQLDLGELRSEFGA